MIQTQNRINVQIESIHEDLISFLKCNDGFSAFEYGTIIAASNKKRCVL